MFDALAHITANGSWFHTGLDASLQALLDAMDREGTQGAVLSGLPHLDCEDAIRGACEAWPGRFVPVAGVDTSRDPAEVAGQVAKWASQGFRGVKVHPRGAGASLEGEGVRAVMEAAGRHGLVAMLCTVHRPPLPALSRPMSAVLHELCAAFPETPTILVHGGYDDLLATSERMRPLEHVLLDLSLTLCRFQGASVGLDAAWLLRSFDRRVCVGSDFPEHSLGEVRSLVEGLGLPRVSLERAFGGNIRQFFGLPDSTAQGR